MQRKSWWPFWTLSLRSARFIDETSRSFSGGGLKVFMCWIITLFRLQDDRIKGTLLCLYIYIHILDVSLSHTVKISQDFLKKQNRNLNLCNLQHSHLYLITFSFSHYWQWLAFYAHSWWGHVQQVIWQEQQQNLTKELTDLYNQFTETFSSLLAQKWNNCSKMQNKKPQCSIQ